MLKTLIPNVEKIIGPLTDLVRQARESDAVDLVYVNDNYGDFTAEFSDLVRSALDGARPDLVEPIVPARGQPPDDQGPPQRLLRDAVGVSARSAGTKRLIITGQVTEQCILYTRPDAYVRALSRRDPDGCGRPHRPRPGRSGVKMMEQNMSAELDDSGRLPAG